MPVKIILWLRKLWDNFGLRKHCLRCHDGSGLMAADIHCRILGTALCWNGRSDWLLYQFDVRLYMRTGDIHYHCSGGKGRVTVTIKGTEHGRVTVTIKSPEHWRVKVTIRSTEHFRVTVIISSTEHCRVTVTIRSTEQFRVTVIISSIEHCRVTLTIRST